MKMERIHNASTWFGWLIFALGASFYSYEYLLRVLPGTMTTSLMQWHHLDPAQLGWLASSYYIPYTLMQLPVGLLLDRFNPKYVLLAAMITCLIGNSAFGATAMPLAVVGRILVGLGSAFAYVGVLRLATYWLPISQFGIAAGLVNTVGMIGGMVADVTLSPVVAKLGAITAIHMATLIGLPILLALIFVPRRPAMLPQVQPLPVLATEWSEIFKRLRHLVKQPWLWLNALLGCTLYIPLAIFAELWGIAYLEATQHISATTAGSAIAWLLLGMAAGTPLAGYLFSKYRHPLRIMLCGSSLALCFMLILLDATFSSAWLLSSVLFLFGLSAGVQVLVIVQAKAVVAPHEQATALAFTNMLIILGGMLFQPLVGALLKSQGVLVNGVMTYSASAYQHAMLAAPVVIVIAILLLILLGRVPKPYLQTANDQDVVTEPIL